jgi:pyruvate-formate lyase
LPLRLRASASDQTDGRTVFYDAALIALQAAQEYMLRYARFGGGTGARRSDAARAQELERIAANCRWLAEHPARDFHEALQAVWFLFVLLQIESNASSFSPGRFDQYMLPYLEADLTLGRLTLADAQERARMSVAQVQRDRAAALQPQRALLRRLPHRLQHCARRATADGRDATNLLSFMCLRAQADLGMTQPNLSIRIHEHSPDDFLRAASFVIGKGSGMPQVFNDEVIIPGQIARGVTLEDARNYAVVGCVELSTPGKALGWSDASMFNLTRVLELTLFGGKDPQSGAQIGLRHRRWLR